MKRISLIFLLLSFFNANCQNITKKLQNKTWFAKGDILKPEKVTLHAARPVIFMPELRFLDDHNFQLKTDTVSDFTFVCLYQFKKDMVRIYYTENSESQKGSISEKEISHYYKIRSIQNSPDFELIPLSSADFK